MYVQYALFMGVCVWCCTWISSHLCMAVLTGQVERRGSLVIAGVDVGTVAGEE